MPVLPVVSCLLPDCFGGGANSNATASSASALRAMQFYSVNGHGFSSLTHLPRLSSAGSNV